MAPAGTPRTGTGRTARPGSTVEKEREKIGKLSDSNYEKRRIELGDMPADEVRSYLKSVKADEWQGDDSGLLKAKVFHLLGLGEPPRKYWTKTSAIFMLDERGYAYADNEIDNKKSAIATLTTARRDSVSDKPTSARTTATPVPRQLFTHTKTTEDRRAELLQELAALGESDPAAKRPRDGEHDIDASAQHGWAQGLRREDRQHLGEVWLRETGNPVLSQSCDEWKKLINFSTTAEFVDKQYERVDIRGLHFYTATVRILREHPQMRGWDKTGYGQAPETSGNHDLAEEWLDAMYTTGVRRMGGGAQFEQVHFSKVARKSLAGAGNGPPDPLHMAMFFSQLLQAGEKGGRQRAENTEGPGYDSREPKRAHVEVPADVLARVRTAAEQLAPPGMDRTILDKAVHAVAARKGENFREKQLTGLRSLGQGRAKGAEGKEYGDMVSTVAVNARQQTDATVSLSTEALYSARITAGNASLMNLESKDVHKCILSALQRTFSGDHFKMHLLVARVPGTPTQAELEKAFGEANDCKRDARTIAHTTAEHDRKYYTYLQRAMQALHVLVTPDLDVGFATELKWFADGVTNFAANGTPMCLVTRAISKCLLLAQRQRNQVLLFADNSGEEMLNFHPSESLRDAKMKLMDWDREAQIDQQIQWARCFAEATAQGTPTGGAGSGGRHVRYPPGESPYAYKPGQGPPKPDTSTTPPARKTVKFEGLDINFNKIEKKLWDNNYGEIRVGGKVVLLCWYFCNRPGGCVKGTDCSHEHGQYPAAYKSKPLAKCSTTFQKEVLAKCTSA